MSTIAVTFMFAAIRLVESESKTTPLKLRSEEPILVNGEPVESKDGTSTLALSPTQADAFRALMSSKDGKAALKSGAITLPIGKRGRQAATGQSLAELLG